MEHGGFECWENMISPLVIATQLFSYHLESHSEVGELADLPVLRQLLVHIGPDVVQRVLCDFSQHSSAMGYVCVANLQALKGSIITLQGLCYVQNCH